jgi:hypothetical protein
MQEQLFLKCTKVRLPDLIEKPAFKVMKINFFEDIEAGFDLVRSYLEQEDGDYIRSFCAIDLSFPDDKKDDESFKTRLSRKIAAYKCCLYAAGFTPAKNKVSFDGNKDINAAVRESKTIDPNKGISYEDAIQWFTWVWENYDNDFFTKYKNKKGKEWADEDLKSILVFLTRKRRSGANRSADVSGYRKFRSMIDLHTSTVDKPFEVDILELLRAGKIVIVDLSQGDPQIQRLYSERICRRIYPVLFRRGS